jgi:pseudolysin
MKTIALLISIIALPLSATAATSVDLAQQPVSFLKQHPLTPFTFKEIKRSIARHTITHIRIQQTYQNYPVYGADAVIHIPGSYPGNANFLALINDKTYMNGRIYSDLASDLTFAPTAIFTEQTRKALLTKQISAFKHNKNIITQPTSQHADLIVYVDYQEKAHWAYKIHFIIKTAVNRAPEKPTYIIDALDGKIYLQWNDMKTTEDELVSGGGFAGNHKTGQKILDSAPGHVDSLNIYRNPNTHSCKLENPFFKVKSYRNLETVSFLCELPNVDFNEVYWNGNFDQVGTSWSPSNDVLFGAEATQKMFLAWYEIPVLSENHGSRKTTLKVHDPMINAYWDGNLASFGDSLGSSMFNPFTQLDTVTHELCHGFTEQNANLNYYGQSGGLNESFSDMAGIAAEFFIYKHTDFLVGYGDLTAKGKSLRYMDKPSKDCAANNKPGRDCSIDHISQYHSKLNVHYSSGIFNHVFYVLANSPHWDPRMAFDIMVEANLNYWTSNTQFIEAACGVLQSANDLSYTLTDVQAAFTRVGIDTQNCKIVDSY